MALASQHVVLERQLLAILPRHISIKGSSLSNSSTQALNNVCVVCLASSQEAPLLPCVPAPSPRHYSVGESLLFRATSCTANTDDQGREQQPFRGGVYRFCITPAASLRFPAVDFCASPIRLTLLALWSTTVATTTTSTTTIMRRSSSSLTSGPQRPVQREAAAVGMRFDTCLFEALVICHFRSSVYAARVAAQNKMKKRNDQPACKATLSALDGPSVSVTVRVVECKRKIKGSAREGGNWENAARRINPLGSIACNLMCSFMVLYLTTHGTVTEPQRY